MRFWTTDLSYNDFFNRLGCSRKLRQPLHLCILGYVDQRGGAFPGLAPFGKGCSQCPQKQESVPSTSWLEG
jgi:hypothetical protein